MKSGNISKSLWIGVALMSLLFVGAPYLLSGLGLDGRFDFIEFLDRHWMAKKQEFIRKNRANYKPSPKVQILELQYDNTVDFWFDAETKALLAYKLSTYSGPVIVNFHPKRLIKDASLRKILENPNVIRPYAIKSINPLDIDDTAIQIEQLLSGQIEQADSPLLSSGRGIQPRDPEYFVGSNLYGYLEYTQDNVTNFVHEYPLSLQASRLQVPSPILPALAISRSCRDFFFSKHGELILQECEGSPSELPAEIPNPLPLFIYDSFGDNPEFPRVELSKLEDSDKLLIVQVIDQFRFSTFGGSKSTWGDLLATAYSNIEEDHLLGGDGQYEWLLFLALLAGFGVLFFSSYRYRPRGVITASIFVIGGFLIGDFFLGLRTYPADEFFSLMAISMVAVVSRAVRDFEERALIERAFSGYVSDRRLKRLLSGKEELSLTGRTAYLTTMLVDVAGFSKLSEGLSTEKVFQLMQKIFQAIDPEILKYHGMIDKKTGDGLLAVFGDSTDSENPQEAALQAVESALHIQKALKEADLGIKEKVKLRIGINSGQIMVGNTGSERHFNYTVLGDAVNFTQRLEAACPPGRVLIGEETSLLVGDDFELQETKIEVKHYGDLASAFIVLGEKEERTSFVQPIDLDEKSKVV